MPEQHAEALNDRQAQPKAASALASGIIELMIFVENGVDLVCGNADARIPDLNVQNAFAATTPQQHPAAPRVFQRVGDQVADHLL